MLDKAGAVKRAIAGPAIAVTGSDQFCKVFQHAYQLLFGGDDREGGVDITF